MITTTERDVLVSALVCAEATIQRLQRHAPNSALGTLDVIREAVKTARAAENADAMLAMLFDNLVAWQGEEDSVKAEHADLIERLEKLIAKVTT